MGISEWIEEHISFVLIIPLEILLIFLGIIPLILQIYASFTNWLPIRNDFWSASFYGIQNYINFITDPKFAFAVGRTILITALALGAEFLLGFTMAYVFIQQFRGKKILTTMVLVPMMIIPAVSAYMFYMIFLRGGALNLLLTEILGKTILISWLSNSTTAILAVTLAEIWQWTPFVFLVLLSGFLAVPEEPINAAKVLGAKGWEIFKDIILPMSRPIIVLVLILRGIEVFKIFDQIWIMTLGGPGYATQSLAAYVYEEGFKYQKFGYISAGSIIILLALAVISWYLVKPITRRW